MLFPPCVHKPLGFLPVDPQGTQYKYVAPQTQDGQKSKGRVISLGAVM